MNTDPIQEDQPEEELETLRYPESINAERLDRYVERMKMGHYKPHSHAVRASRGMRIQERVRALPGGLLSITKALWANAVQPS